MCNVAADIRCGEVEAWRGGGVERVCCVCHFRVSVVAGESFLVEKERYLRRSGRRNMACKLEAKEKAETYLNLKQT